MFYKLKIRLLFLFPSHIQEEEELPSCVSKEVFLWYVIRSQIYKWGLYLLTTRRCLLMDYSKILNRVGFSKFVPGYSSLKARNK